MIALRHDTTIANEWNTDPLVLLCSLPFDGEASMQNVRKRRRRHPDPHQAAETTVIPREVQHEIIGRLTSFSIISIVAHFKIFKWLPLVGTVGALTIRIHGDPLHFLSRSPPGFLTVRASLTVPYTSILS
jgi:hypothetical protein